MRRYPQYRNDPVGYARDVLHVTLWEKQVEMLEGLFVPPFRILGLSAHNVGKTFAAAVAVNHWYDTRNPGVVITTAPTSRDVNDLLWKEIRLQRSAAGLGQFGSHLQSSPDHYAKGFTAETGESFQGRHDLEMLFVFDEAIGVKSQFWTTVKTMFKPDGQHAWLCIGNPTDTTTQAYLESQETERSGEFRWKTISISALEHPNIHAELAGQAAPYPSAISLPQLDEGLEQNCTPVTEGQMLATDIEWPPESGRYLRPGPIAEARWLGRWPSQGTYGVWNEALWAAVLKPQEESILIPPEIGCDVAWHGDDFTTIISRRGAVALSHETYNGWGDVQIAERLMELAGELAAKCSREHSQREPVKPQDILIKIDCISDLAGAVNILARKGYGVFAINAAATAYQSGHYPNRRSELWFYTAERARVGQVSLARLPKNVLHEIRKQAMGPTWKVNVAGQRVVEAKDETKKRLKRSPDDMDAVNLAYWDAGGSCLPIQGQPKPTPASQAYLGLGSPQRHETSSAARRGLYGRS